MASVTIEQKFCGPPTSGNGGYCAGLLARHFKGPATAVLRARIPLDVALGLDVAPEEASLRDLEGGLIAQARAAESMPPLEIPRAPSLQAAREAEARHIGIGQRFHPICFCCGPEREGGDGLRVFAGQIAGAPEGHLACTWVPHANFADADGRTPIEIIWGALDCPGYFAWVVKEGRHGALLGTMTGDVLRQPKAGETCIITAWPLTRDGRKETSGVALHSADGELLAFAHQVWIVMSFPTPPSAP